MINKDDKRWEKKSEEKGQKDFATIATHTSTELISNLLMYLVPTFVLPSATAAFVMFLDGKPIKPMIKGFFTYPLFLGSWIIINIKCLFKRETTWEKIDHVRNIKIAEVTATDAEEAPEKN